MSNLRKYLAGEPVVEGTKETLIFETNSEPPKSYIGVKPDGTLNDYDKDETEWKQIPVSGGGYPDGYKFEILNSDPNDFTVKISLSDGFINMLNIFMNTIEDSSSKQYNFRLTNSFGFHYRNWNHGMYFSYSNAETPLVCYVEELLNEDIYTFYVPME